MPTKICILFLLFLGNLFFSNAQTKKSISTTKISETIAIDAELNEEAIELGTESYNSFPKDVLIIEKYINRYCDKSVNAIINNVRKSYNIIDYDYNKKCLYVTNKYYLMMDEIMYHRNYLPNSNLNLFIHIF